MRAADADLVGCRSHTRALADFSFYPQLRLGALCCRSHTRAKTRRLTTRTKPIRSLRNQIKTLAAQPNQNVRSRRLGSPIQNPKSKIQNKTGMSPNMPVTNSTELFIITRYSPPFRDTKIASSTSGSREIPACTQPGPGRRIGFGLAKHNCSENFGIAKRCRVG